MRADSGLTLIELLVVVFLLGLLAQAAVLASAGALEEAQQQTTQQTLAQLEIALLGQPQRLDSLGRPNFGGFVADLGGLPVRRGAPASVPPEDAAAVALRELWLRPDADQDTLRTLPPFTVQSTAIDPDVRLACGWRGPYVRLGAGVAALRDGWGHSFLPFDRDGQPATLGGEVAALVSYGDDATPAGTGYAADLSLLVESTGAPWATGSQGAGQPVPARHRGQVPVMVDALADPALPWLVVRVYGPVDGVLTTQQQVTLRLPPTLAAGPVQLTLTTTIGPRLVRAYQTREEPALDTERVPAGPRSPVLPITVEPYAIQPLQLTIQGS